jgi:AcrR family transcriptional regulator
MGKFNLSEAAKEVLDASVASKRGGQDKPARLQASVAYGTKDVGKIGEDPVDNNAEDLPNYIKGVPSATPPGASPPVGQQPRPQLSPQPQQSAGRGDLVHPVQAAGNDYASLRDRVKAKLAPQTFQANPGATFQSYGEETEVEDEDVIEEAEKEEGGHEDAAQDKKMMKAMMKKKMKEDMDALMQGENLSEEFVSKATTIFEAAVNARAEEVISEVEDALLEEFQVAVENIKEEMAEKVDSYLNYMVEEWVKENELAIEKGLRAEIVEEFIEGLRDLFVEHYIDIPKEKVDIVDELAEHVNALEEALNEEINRGVQLMRELNEHKKHEAIYEACEGLSQTQVEKLKTLTEGVEFTTEEEFAEKVGTLKEAYFKSDVKVASNSALDDELLVEDEEVKPVRYDDPSMEVYAKTISKTVIK